MNKEEKSLQCCRSSKKLGLGRNILYSYLEEVYNKQYPFRIIKIGKIYKITKASFDNWINCITSKEDYIKVYHIMKSLMLKASTIYRKK